MAEATRISTSESPSLTAGAAVAAGEVWQVPDGRAGYLDSTTGVDSGTRFSPNVAGRITLPKPTTYKLLKGGRAYWDHSANQVSFKKVNDRDYYLGRMAADAEQADATCSVILNVNPRDDIDLLRDGFATVPVGTQALGGFLPPQARGGSLWFELTATNEAQKVDALSIDGFSKDANAIVEFVFRVPSDGTGTVVDVSMGVANATNATDADNIAESVFIHLDANATAIKAESDDGTTEVAATDTTKTYTEGSDVASRKEVWFDFRDPADVQIYVDGVNVLPSTVFNVNAAAGPLCLLIHLEKTPSTDTYQLAVDRAVARFSEQ